MQSISNAEGRLAAYRTSSDYNRYHVFPVGMLPSLTHFKSMVEAARLSVGDEYSFGPDYARARRASLVRFNHVSPQLASLGYAKDFLCGCWLYLAICVGAFALHRTDVQQIELRHLAVSIS